MAFVIPEVVTSQFHLREGDRVADLGAGSGFYLKPLSKVVGDEGKVFAVEIQRTLAESVGKLIHEERLGNVEVIWGDLEALGGTKITDGSLDAALLSNTLSQIEDKDSMYKECKRILRKGGKLLVIEWTDSWKGMGPAPHMVVTEAQARSTIEGAGFSFERSFIAGEHHYGLAFRA